MNSFEFKFPKNEEVDFEFIRTLNIKRIFSPENASELAKVLNSFILTDFSQFFSENEKSQEKEYKEYVKFVHIFQLSLRTLLDLQAVNAEIIEKKYKKYTKNVETKNKLSKQKKEIANKSEKMRDLLETTNKEIEELQEKIKEMEYSYKCIECFQIFESKRALFIHIKGSHDQKFSIQEEKENFHFVEKEIQTRPLEENEEIQCVLQNYHNFEENISKKLNENLDKINQVFENQTQINDKKNEDLKTSFKELENSRLASSFSKEQEILIKQEQMEKAVKSLEKNFEKNSEIFNSFQNLLLSLHQNETKKLQEIASNLENLKQNAFIEQTDSQNEDSVDLDLKGKMLGHLELLDQKLKNSPRKLKGSQRSPLKVLPPSKAWALGDMESDQDSEENLLNPEELFSDFLRSKNPRDLIKKAEKELKDLIENKYSGNFERKRVEKLEKKLEKRIGKKYKSKIKEDLENSNKKQKGELENILEILKEDENQEKSPHQKEFE